MDNRRKAYKLGFGTEKRISTDGPDIKQFAVHGVPVRVAGGKGVTAALRYNSHSSVGAHEQLTKIHEDVVYGRAWVFPRDSAEQIPGLRLSTLGLVVTSKLRVIHDWTF